MEDWFNAEHGITAVEDLAARYPAPYEIVLRKVLTRLDGHCRTLIGASPFVVVATAGPAGLDCSPRGGAPGFVAVHDDRTLLLPDWPGNNRLDSLRNLLHRPAVALLFLLPGADQVLRVNGSARISTHPDLLARFTGGNRVPRSVVVIGVEEAFIHCPQALTLSGLWDPARHLPTDTLPSLATILHAHLKLSPAEAASSI